MYYLSHKVLVKLLLLAVIVSYQVKVAVIVGCLCVLQLFTKSHCMSRLLKMSATCSGFPTMK